MKKLYLALTILIITAVFAFAGWESYTQLTSPADGDIITVQDVSVTGVGDGSGKISYLTLSGLWSYISTKITASDVAVTDTDENFTETDAEAVLDELYDTKEPSQTPAGQAEMEAGTETAIRSMSPLRVAQAIAAKFDQDLNTTDDPYFASVGTTMVSHGIISSGTQNISPGFNWIIVGGSFTLGLTGFVNGISSSATLVLNHDGNSTVTLPTSVYWEDLDGDGDGDPPVFDSNKNPGRYVLIFMSPNGGITYFGFCTSIYPMAMPE